MMSNDPLLLDGHHILIVGGSSGVGLAIARKAAAQGARLTLAARDPDRLAEAAASVPGAVPLSVDLLRPEEAARAVGDIGPIDHLVVSAGTVGFSTLAESDETEWRTVLEERLIGPLAVIKAAAPSRSILLFSGTIARRPRPGAVLLAAAAAGVEAAVRALSLELAPVRVNALAPGLLDTELLDRVLGAAKPEVLVQTAAKLPVGKVGTADDAADAALLLLHNSYITGTILRIDGGAPLI
jgi:NAD(P)-dependent dehydrogenase (short-subunit alcohol dehydrogenase family)